MTYLADFDAETFDLADYMVANVEPRLLKSSEGRRLLTRVDPLAFAWIYLRPHLRSEETGDRITFADFHLELLRYARTWLRPLREPKQYRDVFIAPRNCGKSTWLHLILPLWAAAHGHVHFLATFSDSSTQAEQHLANLRHELDTNELLRADFPELCTEAKRPDGLRVSTRQDQLHQANGFVLIARGMDSKTLGMKEGSLRPELIVLDDIEGQETTYSVEQARKRRIALMDAILPLNDFARVILVGTTTMTGSLIHQAVKSVRSTEEPAGWIAEERFAVHYFPPIIKRDDGTERSCWPGKWTIEYLLSIRHTRTFAKNYLNLPVPEDGVFWTPESFTLGDVAATRALLSIDPAVKDKKTSDFTGVAVVAHDHITGKCAVRYAKAVRIAPGPALRDFVLGLLEEHDEVGGVLVEVNQGGDTWKAILHDLPVKLATIHHSDPKPVRAARLLNHYERGRVLHAEPLPEAEEQMVAYPHVPHDDLIDAIGTGVERLLAPQQRRKASVKKLSYR